MMVVHRPTLLLHSGGLLPMYDMGSTGFTIMDYHRYLQGSNYYELVK
jgi:hypothetical protein